MRRYGEGMMFKRSNYNRHQVKGLFGRYKAAVIILVGVLIFYFYFCATKISYSSTESPPEISVEKLWDTADSGGWRPSSTPRSDWPPPSKDSNGFLVVRCNGGLNQQRTAICNAVLAARIMNATLVLPELDTNSYWHDDRMAMQFLVEANKRKIETLQMLPAFFTERLYPKNNWIYLIHNKGTKHKVYLKMVDGHLSLYSHEWKAFLKDSGYRGIHMLHFIREEEDLYYVTAYNHYGYECNGYKLEDVGDRQPRCMVVFEGLKEPPYIPWGFLENEGNPEYRILVGDIEVASVTRIKVEIVEEDVYNVHMLGGPGWQQLIEAEHIVRSTRMVFTKLYNNFLQLMLFDGNGLGTRHEVVKRMELNSVKPFVKSPVDTKELRLEHMCEWEDHAEHNDENDVFYAPVVAYVTDRGRLNIFHKFVKSHEMWKFHNALLRYKKKKFYVNLDVEKHSDRPDSKNHVTIKHSWKDIVAKCGWENNKMVRFKLVDEIQDEKASINPRKPVMIPVFDMC